MFVVLRLDLLADSAGLTVTARRIFESAEQADSEAARLNGQATGFQRYVVQSVRAGGDTKESSEPLVGPLDRAAMTPGELASSFNGASTSSLLHAYALLVEQLAARGMGDPYEPPGALWAESLVARYFKVDSIPPRMSRRSGYDFETADGLKVEVKSLVSRANQRSPAVQLPRTSFDLLAVVVLSSRLAVERALVVPIEVVLEHGVASGGGARLRVTDALRAHPNVTDITTDLRAIGDGTWLEEV